MSLNATSSETKPRWFDQTAAVLSTAFGLGYAPIASGTFGSLLGVLIYVSIMLTQPPGVQYNLILVSFVIVTLLGIALGPWAENYWKTKDPRYFVLDEVAGFLLTVLLFQGDSLFLTTLWAFLAARFFDILKPPPAAQLEGVPGGWGIMLDDLMASLYAAAFLHLAAFFCPYLFGK